MTFWDTDEHERGSRANIPRLIEGMAHVLATHDVQQEIFARAAGLLPAQAVPIDSLSQAFRLH